MQSTEIINAELNTNLNSKNIEYVKAPLTRRIFANAVDVIIFVFLLVSFFAGLRAIVSNTSTYKAKDAELTALKLDSGLFQRDKDTLIKETTIILDNSSIDTAESRRIGAISAINKFFSFAQQKCNSSDYEVMLNDYKSFRLSCKAENGTQLFIESNGDVIENPEYISLGSGTASPVFKTYYEVAYKPYINDHLQSYMVSAIPNYLELNRYQSNTLLFGEFLPSFLLAMVSTYLLPTLIFSRGRMTFGKRLYKIALLDRSCLSPSFARTTGRFLIVLLEFILAIPTFCVSFIISFSFMMFSKSHQSVPDYVADVNEISILDNKIFKNFNEIDLDTIDTHKEPIKFKPKNYN